MKSFMLTTLALSLLVGAPFAASSSKTAPLTPAATSRLHTLSSPGLASLRAGSPALRPALKVDERSALRRAASRSQGLDSLRAGAFSDRELIIGIGVLVLVLILI
jgi:hypothetical protein